MNLIYIEYCKLIEGNEIKVQNGVLDYRDYAIETELDRIIEYYSETLSINKEYDINPSILYFENSTCVNAVAFYQNKFYLIGIYLGTIIHLTQTFKDKPNLIFNTGNVDFIEFEKKLDTTISELMYQQALHFTFYHEMGHLIQKSALLNNYLFENLSSD